jgi:hypothetical protein
MKKPYKAERVAYLHRQVIAATDAMTALRPLKGFASTRARLEKLKDKAWDELNNTADPENPVYDLP